MGRQPGNVAAGEINAAFTGARIAKNRHHQGRFAGAIGADQRDDLAFVDINVDTFERNDAAVIRFDAAHREQRFVCGAHGQTPVSACTTSSSGTPR